MIIPAASVESMRGATLDLPSVAGQGGLVIRNPNRPNPLEGQDIELTGTPGDAQGTYKVDGVEGDDLTVTITYEGRAPETSSIHVQGGDRITMTSADKTLTFPLVRK